MKFKTILIGGATALASLMTGIGSTSVILYLWSFSPQTVNGSDAPGIVVRETLRTDKSSEIPPVHSVRISGSGLQLERAGKYHLDQHFDGEFADFETIDISATAFTHDAEGNFNAPYKAIIQGTVISLESMTIDGDRIAFTTTPVRGISYIFAGAFRNKGRCGVDVDTLGMDGQLIKVTDGTLTAVMTANFHLVFGC